MIHFDRRQPHATLLLRGGASRRVFRVGLAAAIAMALAACKDSRRLPPQHWTAAPGPVTVNGIVLDDKSEPSAVATALLDLLKKCRDISSAGLGDPRRAAEFEAARDQIHRLAASEAIFTEASRDPHRLMPHNLTPETAVEIVANNWPAVVGYYIDGLARDSAYQLLDNATQAQVAVRAVSPRDREVIDRITRSLADQRGPRGEPLKPGTEAYNEQLKRQALAEGVCPPIETRIVLALAKESGYWRVAAIRLDRATTAVSLSSRKPGLTTTTQPARSSG